MAKGDYLGEFELHVLAALVRLGDDAYGMTIRREIDARTGRDATIGSVYATLDRLERKGFVRFVTSRAGTGRDGRARKFVAITPSGRTALKSSARSLTRMLGGLGLRLEIE